MPFFAHFWGAPEARCRRRAPPVRFRPLAPRGSLRVFLPPAVRTDLHPATHGVRDGPNAGRIPTADYRQTGRNAIVEVSLESGEWPLSVKSTLR
jgi:hypothetical protein